MKKPSYSVYIFCQMFGSCIFPPLFFALFWWVRADIEFSETLGWSVFGVALIFLPALLYGFITGWIIKLMDLRRDADGRGISSFVSGVVYAIPATMVGVEGAALGLSFLAVCASALILSSLLPPPEADDAFSGSND